MTGDVPWAKKVKHLILKKFTEVKSHFGFEHRSKIRNQTKSFTFLYSIFGNKRLPLKTESYTGHPKCFWADAFFWGGELHQRGLHCEHYFYAELEELSTEFERKKLVMHEVETHFLQRQNAFVSSGDSPETFLSCWVTTYNNFPGSFYRKGAHPFCPSPQADTWGQSC